MLRRDGRRVDAQFLVVGRAPDHFLAPVAEDVGAQRGRGLRAVVRRAAFGGKQYGSVVSSSQFHLKIVLRSSSSLSRSPSQQTPKLHGARLAVGYLFALGVEHAVDARAATQHSKPG